MPQEFPNRERIAHALRDGFGGGRVLVIGDIMLDRYLWGSVERVSPEAPAPVLREGRQSVRAGGAGNVALNLAGLGLEVFIAGFVGDDASRGPLEALLAERHIDTSAVISLAGRPTTTKTRIIAGHQHVLRLDAEDLSPVGQADCDAMLDAALAKMPVDAVVLPDYAKGAASEAVCRRVVEIARGASTPLLVKPKGQDFSKYAGATVLTSNLAELSLASGMPTGSVDELVAASRSVVERLGLQYLVVTRGADGVTLVGSHRVIHSPARPRDVFDISGASDTVIASIAAAMLGGLNESDMLHLVNVAAGFVVGQIGTVAVDRETLLHVLHDEKHAAADILLAVDELAPLAENWRSAGQRIVYTSGAFDGLCADDVRQLRHAAGMGDKLVVGVTRGNTTGAPSDESAVTADQQDRASVLASLNPVDAVVMCKLQDHGKLMEVLQPDIVVNGGVAA